MNIYKLEKITNELNIYKDRLTKIVDYDNYKNYIEIDCLDIQEDKVEGIFKFINGTKKVKELAFCYVLNLEVKIIYHPIIFKNNEIIISDRVYGKNYIIDLTNDILGGTNEFWLAMTTSELGKKKIEAFSNKALLEGNNW